MNRFPYPQSVKTLRSTCGAMLGPASSNSSLVIHMDWKVAKEERMDPPIHTEYLRSRCNHLDLHGGWCKGDHLLGETLLDAGVHGGAAGHNDVAVQVLADVHIALHDGLVGGLVHTLGLLANQGWVEEHLGAAESLVSDLHRAAVGQLVHLLAFRGLLVLLHLGVEVKGHVGELLLDVTHDLTLGCGGERVTSFVQDLHHVLGEVAASKIDTLDGVGKGVTFVDRHGVGHTITRVKHDTSGTAGRVQRKHSLDVHVHRRHGVRLEHDLGPH